MIQDRTCRQCGAVFQGGPRAYYCPDCRHERQQEQNREHKRRKRAGLVRAVGSIDRCDHCSKEYTVTGGNQRYCPECGPMLLAEHDRVTGLQYYHDNKTVINPVRNKRRRIGLVICKECGKEFDPEGTRKLYCTQKCRRKTINRLWMKRYYPSRLKKPKQQY